MEKKKTHFILILRVGAIFCALCLRGINKHVSSSHAPWISQLHPIMTRKGHVTTDTMEAENE